MGWLELHKGVFPDIQLRLSTINGTYCSDIPYNAHRCAINVSFFLLWFICGQEMQPVGLPSPQG
jgi:hypothetical protein